MLNYFRNFKSFKNLKNLLRNMLLLSGACFLAGCDGFFDKDNLPKPTPLVDFAPEITPHLIWSTPIGKGPGREYLKMHPAMTDRMLYTAGTNGTITAIDKTSGRIIWQVRSKLPLASGPGAGDDIVVAASTQGDVIAMRADTGQLLWRTNVKGEVLSQPAIGGGKVIIKCIDGSVYGLNTRDGETLWSTAQTEPNLILHAASAPLLQDQNRYALVGFANGHLLSIGTEEGRIHWQQTIATPQGGFAIERMVDIDADPFVYHTAIYAATYQGKIAALDGQNGTTLWSHDLSSYTGMTADDDTVYVSDADSHLWAFSAKSGQIRWQQTQLYARIVSGPTVLGRYVVVGDAQGYLHWLAKTDGHFAGRVAVGAAIYASPVADDHAVYVLTSKGRLTAYTYFSRHP